MKDQNIPIYWIEIASNWVGPHQNQTPIITGMVLASLVWPFEEHRLHCAKWLCVWERGGNLGFLWGNRRSAPLGNFWPHCASVCLCVCLSGIGNTREISIFPNIYRHTSPLMTLHHIIPSSTNLYWPSTSQYRRILTQYHHHSFIILLEKSNLEFTPL